MTSFFNLLESTTMVKTHGTNCQKGTDRKTRITNFYRISIFSCLHIILCAFVQCFSDSICSREEWFGQQSTLITGMRISGFNGLSFQQHYRSSTAQLVEEGEERAWFCIFQFVATVPPSIWRIQLHKLEATRLCSKWGCADIQHHIWVWERGCNSNEANYKRERRTRTVSEPSLHV